MFSWVKDELTRVHGLIVSVPSGLFYQSANLEEYERNAKSIGLFIFLAFIGAIIYIPSFPVDDGLRHAVAWMYDYDYKSLYGAQYPFDFDPWIGIEKIYRFLQLFVTKDASIQIVQAITIALYLLGASLLLSRMNWPMLLLGISMVAALALPRLLDARPDSLSSAFFLLILGVYSLDIELRIKRAIAAILVAILTLLYHFAWIYLLPLALFDAPFFLIVSTLSVGWWIWYSDGEWIEFAKGLFELGKLREGIQVSENTFSYIILSAMAAILFMFFRKSVRKICWRYWLVLLWFALPNQARYLYLIYTLTVIYVLWGENMEGRVPNPLVWIVMIVIGVYTFSGSYNPPPKPIHLPPNQKIVCDNMDIMYRLIYASDNKIAEITPPMEIGYAYRWYIKMVKSDYDKNGFCDFLKDKGYTMVAEKSLYKNYHCLRLYRPYGLWRIWNLSFKGK